MEEKITKSDEKKVGETVGTTVVDGKTKSVDPISDKSEKEKDAILKNSKEEKNERRSRKKKLIGCGCTSLVLVIFAILLGGVILGFYTARNLTDFLKDRGVTIEWLTEKSDSNDSSIVTQENKIVKVTSEESQVIEVVQENMHSVVSVAISQLELQPGTGVVDRSNNIGSGFIVDENGLIITNQHVVSDQNADYKVITEDGEEYEVQDIVRDDFNDIALLKIDAEGLDSAELGDSDALIPGQMVIAIGTPLGEYAGSVTTGVISGLDRSVSTSSGSFFGTVKTFENVIQIDAAVNPGNSGGPLLNSSGEVIGVNFATTSGADNISFALPINRVVNRLEEYRIYGKFLRPFVGIEYEMITESQARYYTDILPGAFVRSVVDGSPAQDAGIKRGDIIVQIEGDPVVSSFIEMIQKFKIGDSVEMKILRDGKEVSVSVVLGEAD